MTLSQKQQGHLIMLLVMTIFGLNIPINKYLYANELLSPMAMTLLRMSFAAIVFWIVSLFTKKEKVARKDLGILAIGGLCGMLINQSLFAIGLGQTSSVDASIITTSGPLFAMVLAAIILKEPITVKKFGGVIVGGAGAVFLVYSSGQVSTGQGSAITGDICVLSAQMFYAFYLVITRPLSTRYSPITMMKWMFLVAAVIDLPLGYRHVMEAPMFAQHDILPFLLLSFTLVGATFITYLLIPLAQRRIRPTTISMYNNMQPLIASGVAIYMGMDRFTVDKLIAGILIFSGVYLVTVSKSKADLEAEASVEKK